MVLQVYVVHNNELLDNNGIEQEQKGIDFLINWSGGYTLWKQTSYNGNFRKNYAGIGYTSDEQRDAFIPPKHFNSWVLNESSCQWEAPVAMPNDGQMYYWDESIQNWALQNTP